MLIKNYNPFSTFCRQYLAKRMSSVDVWKFRDCSGSRRLSCRQSIRSRPVDPQQQNADDRTRSVGSAVRPTSAEWQTVDVDDQWRLLLAYNCPSSTAEQFHGGIDTWALRAWIILDRWHRASGAHHAVVATNRYGTSKCCTSVKSRSSHITIVVNDKTSSVSRRVLNLWSAGLWKFSKSVTGGGGSSSKRRQTYDSVKTQHENLY